MVTVLSSIIRNILLGLALLSAVSCAGYRFRKIDNPFQAYDIQSLAVPMFVNRSVFHNVNIPLTREIKLALSEYPGLKIYAGDDSRADAVLIGIIESRDQMKDAILTDSTKFTDGDLSNSIGQRAPFYVPNRTYYEMQLRLVIIKKPTKEEMELLQGPLITQMVAGQKIIMNNVINLRNGFTRVVDGSSTTDEGGIVNSVKNREMMNVSFENLAKNAASNFKQVVINAF
jgi:hypothetical protein